jgi:hypothetical protein
MTSIRGSGWMRSRRSSRAIFSGAPTKPRSFFAVSNASRSPCSSAYRGSERPRWFVPGFSLRCSRKAFLPVYIRLDHEAAAKSFVRQVKAALTDAIIGARIAQPTLPETDETLWEFSIAAVFGCKLGTANRSLRCWFWTNSRNCSPLAPESGRPKTTVKSSSPSSRTSLKTIRRPRFTRGCEATPSRSPASASGRRTCACFSASAKTTWPTLRTIASSFLRSHETACG